MTQARYSWGEPRHPSAQARRGPRRQARPGGPGKVRPTVQVIAVLFVLFTATAVAAQTPEQDAFFESSVKPVLARCSGCHSTTAMGGLRVDSREALVKGGASGPAIVVGDPDKSLLIAAVKHTGALKMPMGGDKLADDQIAGLAAWIKNGAAWPAAKAGAKPEAVLS